MQVRLSDPAPDALRARAAMLLRTRSRVAEGATAFKRIPLYAKQAAIVDDPARFTITEATTKAGKTASHIEWILENASRVNEGEWWWVAQITDVADIAFRRVVKRLQGLMDSGGTYRRVSDPIPFQKNETRKFIKLGGSTIWFKSADEPDSLFGEDVRGAVGDEITRWKEASWHALYTTLTATQGRAKLIGNVKGRKNFAYRLARKAEAGEPGWGHHRLTADDAIEGGVLRREVIEQARRDLPERVFKELFYAEAGEDEGNPFGAKYIAACVAPLSKDTPIAWGWDVAKSVDWTVGIGLDRKGYVSGYDRFQTPWEITHERMAKAIGNTNALVDSTGVGDSPTERLQKRCPNVRGFKFSQQSKQQLMIGLAVAIQSGEIHFPDGPIRSELEAFEYEYTASGVKYSAPAGMHDDCVCALALAVEQWRHTTKYDWAPISIEQPSAWTM